MGVTDSYLFLLTVLVLGRPPHGGSRRTSRTPGVPGRNTKTLIHVAVVIETLIRGGESHFLSKGYLMVWLPSSEGEVYFFDFPKKKLEKLTLYYET